MEKKVDIRRTKDDKLKLEKQILENINTDIFTNLIISILMMIYFVLVNLAFSNIDISILKKDLEVFCLVFLFIGIFVIERAYKKDSGKIAIYGIETLIFSFHTLTINHFVKIYNLDFQVYILTSSYIFSIYYVLKCILIYTMAKRKYLTNLSDISEIVKDEPTKKEATKKVKKEVKIEDKKNADKQKDRLTVDVLNKTRKKKSKTQEIHKQQIEDVIIDEQIKEDDTDKEKIEEKPKRKTTKKSEKAEKDIEIKTSEKKTTRRKATKKEEVEETNKDKEENIEEVKPKRRGRPPKKKVEVND